MVFEFDPKKSKINLDKHGIDFERAKLLWADPDLVFGPGTSVTEERWLAVGVIDKTHWVACFTRRGDAIRIIACRKAREEEKEIYELSK